VISAKKYISCQYLSAGIIKDIIGIPRTRVFNEIVWSPDDIFSVLCIPGNISSDLKELQSIFQVLVSKFDAVCYIPGEIILENSTSKVTKQNESKISEDTEMTLEYYKKVLLLAKSCRLYIGPLRVQTKGGAVIIFPLYSWRQENVFFTNEDEIDTTEIRLFSAIVHEKKISTLNLDENLTKEFATINETFLHPRSGVKTGSPLIQDGDFVISFSYSVPTQELMLEKRFSKYTAQSVANGYYYLDEQIRRLRPCLHIYGRGNIPLAINMRTGNDWMGNFPLYIHPSTVIGSSLQPSDKKISKMPQLPLRSSWSSLHRLNNYSSKEQPDSLSTLLSSWPEDMDEYLAYLWSVEVYA